ncbi:muconolactone Delta-isomerase family protein [Goodfellowiella coeruleoviolacea]|uniref:Muconolactone delta-isomerase n=1 Tax=Goodfellowiella coeruleoviolacea TaxID=334858 RepID=A0AAE3GE48_9PSEU|nr:muconolactone Delta-isomerase family protein [Goodfellowiella coeruleoviolacea]MCP2166480.1 Muconolactone delta-isomerase [Goodfellowiella coeruleoviolacea]
MVITHRYSDRFTDEDYAAVLPEETDTVRQLFATGAVRQIWSRGDIKGACFLVEADSPADAEAVVATLPLAQKKMSNFQIIPLHPYVGFGPA